MPYHTASLRYVTQASQHYTKILPCSLVFVFKLCWILLPLLTSIYQNWGSCLIKLSRKNINNHLKYICISHLFFETQKIWFGTPSNCVQWASKSICEMMNCMNSKAKRLFNTWVFWHIITAKPYTLTHGHWCVSSWDHDSCNYCCYFISITDMIMKHNYLAAIRWDHDSQLLFTR